jgi:hypothetical protein
MAQNSTEQVSLEPLDRLSSSLGELPSRATDPGELVERAPEPKRRRRG